MLISLAFRNIFLHKSKTLILGLVIAIGLFVLVVGNSFLDSATRGLESTYTSSFTGQLAVVPDLGDHLPMFTANPPPTDASILLPGFSGLIDFVEGLPEVHAVSPQLDARAAVQYQENPVAGTLIFAIDPGRYRKAFPDNLDVIHGSFLKPGQEGVLLSEAAWKALKAKGAPHEVGDPITLSSRNDIAGTKIRNVTLRGVVRFHSSNAFLSLISLSDAGTAQYLTGAAAALASLAAPSSPGEGTSAGASDLNPEVAFSEVGSLVNSSVSHHSALQELSDVLKTAGSAELPPVDAWTFLIVGLKDPRSLGKVSGEISSYLTAHKLDARVQDWIATAGPLAETAFTIKTIFNWLIVVVGLVALLIIMNTLAISVSERFPEIGTMRAIGAGREFVRALIIWETLLTTIMFGLLGIVLGVAAVGMLGIVGIHAPNEFLAVILGGSEFHPSISWIALAESLSMTVVVGLLASLYPVSLAVRIPPLRAIQAE
jgi:putative ABC transport system permease protein